MKHTGQAILSECIWDKEKATLTLNGDRQIPNASFSITSHKTGITYLFRYSARSYKIYQGIGIWTYEPEDFVCPVKKLYISDGVWEYKEPYREVESTS